MTFRSLLAAALLAFVLNGVASAQSSSANPAAGRLTVTATIAGSISLLVEPAVDSPRAGLALVATSSDAPAVRVRTVRVNGGNASGNGTVQFSLSASGYRRVAQS